MDFVILQGNDVVIYFVVVILCFSFYDVRLWQRIRHVLTCTGNWTSRELRVTLGMPRAPEQVFGHSLLDATVSNRTFVSCCLCQLNLLDLYACWSWSLESSQISHKQF